MHPLELTQSLYRMDLLPVIAWLREWLRSASYADIRAFSEQLPDAKAHAHFLSLVRDVITGYPGGLWGAPVLLYYSAGTNSNLTLPLAEYAPDPDITNLSWMPLDVLHRQVPYRPSGDLVSVCEDEVSCAILAITTHHAAPPELPGEWWGDLFYPSPATRLRVSAQRVMPFPEAVEAGAALLAAVQAGTWQTDTPRLFLSDRSWAWALDMGLAWRNALLAQYDEPRS